MGWIFLAGSEELVSHCKTGLNQSLFAKSKNTVKQCSCRVCIMENLQKPQYGTTSQLCKDHFCQKSILSTEDSPAKISVLQALEKAWKDSEADYFSRSCAWPKKSSPSSYFLKTCPQLQVEADYKSLKKLPRSGMIVDGVLYPLKALEQCINANDGFCWPTPQARAQTDTPSERKRHTPCLHTAVLIGRLNPESIGKKLCPKWVSVLMGYPTTWTDCEHWVIQWCRNK